MKGGDNNMYNNVLKEETERVVFQYTEELKIKAACEKILIDEYLKDIQLDVEAYESYEYHTKVINDKFKLDDIMMSIEIDRNFKAFFKDFYKSVRTAFIKELEDEYKLVLGNADEMIEEILKERYKAIEETIEFEELDDSESLLG